MVFLSLSDCNLLLFSVSAGNFLTLESFFSSLCFVLWSITCFLWLSQGQESVLRQFSLKWPTFMHTWHSLCFFMTSHFAFKSFLLNSGQKASWCDSGQHGHFGNFVFLVLGLLLSFSRLSSALFFLGSVLYARGLHCSFWVFVFTSAPFAQPWLYIHVFSSGGFYKRRIVLDGCLSFDKLSKILESRFSSTFSYRVWWVFPFVNQIGWKSGSDQVQIRCCARFLFVLSIKPFHRRCELFGKVRQSFIVKCSSVLDQISRTQYKRQLLWQAGHMFLTKTWLYPGKNSR